MSTPGRVTMDGPNHYRTDAAGTLDAMRSWVATDPRDWSLTRTDARLWAVLFGWGGEGVDDEDDDAWPFLAAQHGWDDEFVAALKARQRSIASNWPEP